MAQVSIPLTVRRARRQRRVTRLQQLGDRTPSLLRKYGRAIAGMAVVLTVTAGTLVLRSAPPAAIPAEVPQEYIGYVPDELRPDLELVDESNMPLPATYIVEEDDTLLGIALRFGSSAEVIRVASGLGDADFIRIGQTLTIPPPRSILQPVDAERTLDDLQYATGLEVSVLAAYNRMDPAVLEAPLARSLVVLPPAQRVVARDGAGSATNEVDATTYIIEPGDTLSEIAEKLGVEPRALIMANRLFRPDQLAIGDQLKLPGWSTTAEQEEPQERRAPVVYEVAPGDTIGDLALQFGVDPATIVVHNELRSADQIRVGDQLTILPVSGLMYTVRPGDTLADIAETYKVDLGPIIDFNYFERLDYLPVGKEILLPGARPLPRITLPTTHTVRPGETVSGIARRFGVDGDDIIAANNLRSADRIVEGSDLRIVPGAAAAAAAAARQAAQNRAAAPATTLRAASVPQQQVTVNRAVPAQAPAPARQAVSSGTAGGTVSLAMQFLGSRYVFGGTTPAGFDCSGFVYYVFNRSGIPLSRGMWGQYGAGSHPSRAELRPGDIVFFQNTYMAGLSHNGIYIGNGQFVHASDERSGVRISSLSESYWASRWFGATRL